MTVNKTLSYIIQERCVLRCLTANFATAIPYFSPASETVELLHGAPEGVICIGEHTRSCFDAGIMVLAIIILDPLARRFQPGETQHEFRRDQISFGIVKKRHDLP
ncbi:MAG: hypothetical protein OJF51_001850 [Nitrospira sp.]|nr:MAG: hypothetical protein OJF51_001850 [Nitrospira sp.]